MKVVHGGLSSDQPTHASLQKFWQMLLVQSDSFIAKWLRPMPTRLEQQWLWTGLGEQKVREQRWEGTGFQAS